MEARPCDWCWVLTSDWIIDEMFRTLSCRECWLQGQHDENNDLSIEEEELAE